MPERQRQDRDQRNERRRKQGPEGETKIGHTRRLDENTLVRVCRNYEIFRIDMVKTYGLTHVAVAVRDLDRTEAFYGGILGAKVVYRDAGFLQMQTPGSRDVLVFEKNAKKAGKAGGVLHFGFRLTKEKDIAAAREAVKKAGGTITDTGEFIPGEPYLFATDPDGYTIEIGTRFRHRWTRSSDGRPDHRQRRDVGLGSRLPRVRSLPP